MLEFFTMCVLDIPSMESSNVFIINSKNTDLERTSFFKKKKDIWIDMDIRKTKTPQLLRLQGFSE